VRDGAVVQRQVSSTGDLPQGWHDEQAPGHYRLHHDDDPSLFAWAVGPGSPKSEFYPARSLVWRATSSGDVMTLEQPQEDSTPVALIGSRPCDLAGLRVLDRVFAGERYRILTTAIDERLRSSSSRSAGRRQARVSAPRWAPGPGSRTGSMPAMTWR